MTYAAPRQGLFTVIVLIALSLNLLLFVIGQQNWQTKNRQILAEQQALALSDELAGALNIGDRISMSVIVNRRITLDGVAFIGVYDSNEALLVPVGKESPVGFAVKEVVTSGDSVLGYVLVQTHGVNRADIISGHWLYLVGVFFLHFVLWLLYGYVARPPKSLRQEIALDVRNQLIAKEVLHEDTPQETALHNAHNTQDNQPHTQPTKPNSDTSPSKDVQTDDMDTYVIQIRFNDPEKLLETVSYQHKGAFFTLYKQLTERTVQELLALPLLMGVGSLAINDFDDYGTTITLTGNAKVKTATAAVMLSRLMLMLGQIIYDKHVELGRFALPIRTFVSTPAKQSEVLAVGKKYRQNPLALLPESVLSTLASQVRFERLINPGTVTERETRHLGRFSETNSERLKQVRDKVLLSS